MSHVRINLRLFLCSLGLLLCIPLVQANNYVAERSWIEDSSNSMTLEQVQALPQNRLQDNLFGTGFSRSTFWIRLQIDPSRLPISKSDESLVIRIRPVYQDEVWIYDSLSPQDKERVTGDYHDWADDEWQSLNLNFVIPLGKAPRDVWLKLRTHQALYTSIDVLTERQAIASDRRQDVWSMFSLASLGFIFAWGSLMWVSKRDPLIGWFNLRTVAVIAYIFFLMGYGRMFLSNYLPAPLIDYTFNISLWVFVSAAIWFDSKLLQEFKANRTIVLLTKLLVIGLPIELLTIFLGRIDLGVRVNFLITLIAIVLVFIGAISARAWKEISDNKNTRKPVVSKAVFVGLYSLAILTVIYNRLAIMRIIPPPENLLDYLLLQTLPISFFMMMLLHLRSYKQSQQHHAELRELDGVRREAEFERKRHLEDERFISMLTHELKTPISVAKINLDMSGIDGKERDRIERALKNMTDVVERCRISSAMEDSRLQLDKTTFSVPDAIDGALSLLGRPERVKFFEVNEVLVDSDSQLCGIVISNLLDNALKYSPTNSPISIRYAPITHEGKLGVSIFVANEVGAGGLPDPARMFTKYYRAKTAASKSGSGLGLYISTGIAQILGGFLRYQTPDNQLEFEFWLPA